MRKEHLNNPYLINLLTYLIKKSFKLDYDTPLSQADIDRIENKLAEQKVFKTQDADNFFRRRYPAGIGMRYSSSVHKLNLYCKLISCDKLQYDNWRAFSNDHRKEAAAFEIPKIRNLKGSQVHEYYFGVYEGMKEQIKLDILSKFGEPSQRVLSTEVYFQKPPYLVGKERSDKIRELATYLLNPSKPLGIIGMAGSGKTNFALNLIADKKVEELYGAHRFIVHCETATSFEIFLSMLAHVTRTPLMQHFANQEDLILSHLKHLEGKKLILFDNFETCDENYPYKLFPFLSKLEAQATVVYTRRGEAPPQGPEWEVWKVRPLTESEATDLFHYHSDKKFKGDEYVSRFLEEVGYLPLAVILIAKRANGRSRLESLYAEWEQKKLKALRIKAYDRDKNFNLELSISLSYDSPRLTDEDRQLLNVLCIYPLPISLDLLKERFPDAYEQTDRLIDVGLLEESEPGLQSHATIREFMKVQTIETEPYLSLLTDLYLDKIIQYKYRKMPVEIKKLTFLLDEWENVYQALAYSIENKKGIEALCEMGLIVYSVDSFKLLLEQALKKAHASSWKQLEVDCLCTLADIALLEGDYDLTKKLFNDVLLLSRSIEDKSYENYSLDSLRFANKAISAPLVDRMESESSSSRDLLFSKIMTNRMKRDRLL